MTSSPDSHHIIAIVGMCGSGKSIVSDTLVHRGYHYIRFGQITLDEIQKRNLKRTAETEQAIREELRAKHGMAAYATLSLPSVESHLSHANVVIDGLYSWSEYKELKNRFGDQLYVVCVYSPPALRYERLTNRQNLHIGDTQHKFRSFSKEDARRRDFAEIENLEKGGPIAMADYTILNTTNQADLFAQLDDILENICHAH